MNLKLTDRQGNLLDYISGYLKHSGYPPTLREISAKAGVSVRTVRFHLAALARKKYINLIPGISRGIELRSGAFGIPVLGRISAGKPLEALENAEARFDFSEYFPARKDMFILKVRGDSMTGEGIKEGDLLLVRRQHTANNGDIVVALIEGEALVKKFYRDRNAVRLEAANPAYPAVVTRSAEIAGRVTGVIRKICR
jgi:repressor LexA